MDRSDRSLCLGGCCPRDPYSDTNEAREDECNCCCFVETALFLENVLGFFPRKNSTKTGVFPNKRCHQSRKRLKIVEKLSNNNKNNRILSMSHTGCLMTGSLQWCIIISKKTGNRISSPIYPRIPFFFAQFVFSNSRYVCSFLPFPLQ